MKIQFSMSVGLAGCRQQEIIDTEDIGYSADEWVALTDKEKSDEALEWAVNNGLEYNVSEIDEEEE